MSSAPKTDLVYCLRVLEAIGKIDLYAADYVDPYAFFDADDQKNFNACLLLLMHIGEQANRMNESIKLAYAQIPWQAIRGFRNLVAHDYVGINRFIVFDTIRQQLPHLKQQFVSLIQAELANGLFDEADLLAARESTYYRHIDFDQLA